MVRDAWQPTAHPHTERHRINIPSDESRRVTTKLTPQRRGDLHADRVTIRALGPLGLGGRQASLEVPGQLRVHPAFNARRNMPSKLMVLSDMDGPSRAAGRG